VYEAVIRWVQYDVDRRWPKLETLLASVRCHFLSPCFITSQLKSCPILQRVSACGDYLRRIVDELTEHRCCKERRRRMTKPAIYIIGGYLRHSLAAVECWSPVSKQWYRLASLTTPRSGIAACQVSFDIISTLHLSHKVCLCYVTSLSYAIVHSTYCIRQQSIFSICVLVSCLCCSRYIWII